MNTTLINCCRFQAYLEALPRAPMYERSYMHRDVVTHAVMTPCGTDFLVTASTDGHIKFWKKMPEGVEFVKHYHSHLEPIHDLAVRIARLNPRAHVLG